MKTLKQLSQQEIVNISDVVAKKILEKLEDFEIDPPQIIYILNLIKIGTVNFFSKPHAKNPEIKSLIQKLKKIDIETTKEVWKEIQKTLQIDS